MSQGSGISGEEKGRRKAGSQTGLHSELRALDGASYGAYKRLKGRWTLGIGPTRGTLHIDHVQSDPYAPASRLRLALPVADLPFDPRHVAARDLLLRHLGHTLADVRGASIDTPGQSVLARAAAEVHGADLYLRIEVSLPARGRRILGRAAANLLCDDLPTAVADAVGATADADPAAAVALYEDQEFLRAWLPAQGLVAFVADGSVLPRRAGDSDLPLSDAVPFRGPETLRVDVELPSGRRLSGLGIPTGVTVIVGGGYHGKSTLLRALERGVYNHIAGDGREFAITVPAAAALRAEDGRAITAVDISEFINGLPSGADTTAFSTTNASGSTSQAAALVEALEAGATALLIDEDTSATNFMIRDARMRELVPARKEPITALVERVRGLWEGRGVSTVLVAGGSAAFLDVADTVIALDSYVPRDATHRARELAEPIAPQAPFSAPRRRRVFGPRPDKAPRARGRHEIQYGRANVDLSALTQLVDASQTAAIAALMPEVLAGERPLVEAVRAVLDRAQREGVGTLGRGRLAMPRLLEAVAALNRYRGLTAEIID